MPNWKTYESSVRLLSAIIAAHPSLKLNYDAIAREYGDGVTGKAVSTYFERAKKDLNWDRSRSAADIKLEGTPVKTPVSRKRVPSKKKAAAVDSSMDDDETETAFDETPTKKKTPLNKVAGGRVTKASGGRSKPRLNYAEPDDEDDDVDEELTIVKSEDAGNPFTSNGHSNGNGHAHSNGHDNGYGNDYEENGYTASGAEETYYIAAGEDYV